MKQKLIAALKTKYQRFGLSNEAVDRIASAKEKTVTTDEEIEGAIADAQTMELIASELQKSADAERRKNATLQKSFDDYKAANPVKTDPQEGGGNGDPGTNAILEKLNALSARLDAKDAEEKQKLAITSIRARLEKEGCTNKGILNSVFKGFTFKDGESEDAATARLKDDYNQSYKDTFGSGPLPGSGSGGGQKDDEKAFIKSLSDFADSKGLKQQ